MIIVPKSLKLRHWLQNIEEVNIRASSLCFFWRGDMKPCSRHKETPVEGRTCQQSRNLKNAVCVSAGEKKTNHPTWPLETFNPPGNKTISIMKRKIIDAKVPSGRGYMLVHVSQFQSCTWKMAISPNILQKIVVKGSRNVFLFKMFLSWRSVRVRHDKRPRWDRIPRVRSGFQIWSLTKSAAVGGLPEPNFIEWSDKAGPM